jgi:pimeloyl-ACP methyl ester carboxylesterase
MYRKLSSSSFAPKCRRAASIAITATVCIATSHAQEPPKQAAVDARAALAIDEGAFVRIGGIDQWITIRGRSRDNPILLWLHGGPGIGSSSLAPLFAEWENDFTIVQWDQPGGGATDVKNVGVDQGPMTVKRFRDDGLEVATHVLERLRARKLVLMGHSWGTLLGVEMVKAQPDLFSAYVGTSQAVGSAGNQLGYELALKAARERNDNAAVAALERVGPPPYRTFEDFLVRQRYSNPPGLPTSAAEQAATTEFIKVLTTPPPADARYIAFRTIPPGYNGQQVFLNTQRAMFPVIWTWEAGALGTKFDVAVFMFQGADDLNTPAATAREYFDEIQAPQKAFEVIPGVGHNTIVFHRELLKLLRKHVLPIAAR